ncbi:MAG TPA: outer membrane beta-barrel protein [Chryseolinea sp.]
MGIKKLFFAVVFFLGVVISHAQNECELVLTRATEEFNAGHLYGIPAILNDCLNKNQNSAWRQRAYLLLAETYLLLEDPIGAENSYLEVLRANPEYVTDPQRDPIDLVYLSKKFTATPIFAFYAMLGPNTSPVRVIHDVTIGGEAQTQQSYKLRMGWQIGGGVDYNYNDNITFSAGFNYSFTGFQHVTTDLFGPNKDIVEFLDRQTWAMVPLTVRYTHAVGKARPYGYIGYSANFLLRDKGILNVYNRDARASSSEGGAEELTSADAETPNLNLNDHRTRLNGAFLLGGGMKYKYKLDYFFVDVRYSFGLKNLANTQNRFDNYSDGLPYPYVDDDFRLDNFAISVGFIRPFYKPRKLKKPRTKSVFRFIKKESGHATDQP